MITAFIGVKGSGKDYGADALVAQGAVRLDFKDALVDMVEDIVGFKIRDHYELFKVCVVGTTDPRRNNPARISSSALSKQILALCPTAMTGRQLLQMVGTEAMRKRDPEYWVKQWHLKAYDIVVRQGKDVVCADCRFPNEMTAIEKTAQQFCMPAKFVFCDYRSPRYDAQDPHESEAMAQAYLRLGCKDGDILERKEII